MQREQLKFFKYCAGIKGFITVWAKHWRKQFGSQLADHYVAVGHGQWPTTAIRCGSGIGARALRTDPKLAAVKSADRSAARSHGVDLHDRRAQADAGHLGFKGTFVLACEMGHIGRRTAHIEADHLVKARQLRHRRSTDDTTRRTRKYRVLTLKFVGIGKPTRALHKLQPHIAQRRLHLLNIAPQNRRQVGVNHGRVTARYKLHQRRHLMRHADLREANVLRNAF